MLVVALVLAIGGSIAVVVVNSRGSKYPSEWDPRVQDLVAFVEDHRGHDFDHVVPIDFFTDEEYSARTRTDPGELDEAALEQAEQTEGFLRALGLITGDVDLVEAGNDLSDTGTLAFYDPDIERVIVRGTEVTPGLAVTLVHELTHVLQDQAFGLRDLDDPAATSGELFAYRALVEGDAVRIENEYIEGELDDDDQAAIDASNADDLEAVDEQAIPEALQAFFGLPYALGEGFLTFLDAEGGDDAIDEAFRHPPATEEHLLDPFSFEAGDDAVDVESPDPDEGAEVLDGGDFGAASLYLVLGQRIDVFQALAAAEGWGGDAYVDFERDDRQCIILDVVGDEPSDTEEIGAALDAWVAAGPAGSASVSRVGDRIRLDACDPGVEAPAGTASAIANLSLLGTRNYVVADTLNSGGTEAFARCYGDAIIHAFTLPELQGAEEPPDFQARLEAAAAGCVG